MNDLFTRSWLRALRRLALGNEKRAREARLLLAEEPWAECAAQSNRHGQQTVAILAGGQRDDATINHSDIGDPLHGSSSA